MLKRFLAPAIAIAALTFSPVISAQTASPAQGAATAKTQGNENIHLDGWEKPQISQELAGKKPGPAPVHDLTGVWEPAPRYRDGVFASGPPGIAGDAKHEATMPYTPAGKAAFLANKPGFGTTMAPISEINDPFDICDPIGLPRIELFNLRGVQVVQTKNQVLILYQNTRMFRTIWTDGRDFPKEIVENRWFGYSIGKWVDDYTFVVTTKGLDDRTWLDNVGHPHSTDMVVEETFHRLDSLNMELTIKITDPTMYSAPLVPLNKFRLGLNSEDFDLREMICSTSEQQLYNSLLHDAVPETSAK